MSNTSKLSVIILAAGQGSRMKSSLPKVLHPLGGKPLLGHVIDAASSLAPRHILVVYGHGGEQVPQGINNDRIGWVLQAEQLGTGHAVVQAIPQLDDSEAVLVLYGDVPLIKTETLAELTVLAETSLALLTVHLENPTGYGRIIRNQQGHVEAIVEEKDASDKQRKVTEVNTGILAVNAGKLKGWLEQLSNDNAQGEYYLTDVIAMAVAAGTEVVTVHPGDETEVMGVNSRAQLAMLERAYQQNCAEQLMQQGVTIIDPARIDIRGKVNAAQDVTLDINVVLEGTVSLGEGTYIGPNVVIRDCTLAEHVEVYAMSVLEQAQVGSGSRIGPFARLRPGTELAENTHIGNFVEIKNSQVAQGSKINHLSYVGDSTVGARVNIGAGTITCNYDGANKHRTIIGDDAFIGSDSQLVAPVEVGKGATIGAGTTLTTTAPDGELTLTRVKQKTIKGWKRPTKK